MEECSTFCPIIYSEKEFFVGINVGMWEALPGSIYENKWWKGVCVQFICCGGPQRKSIFPEERSDQEMQGFPRRTGNRVQGEGWWWSSVQGKVVNR